MSRILLTGGTGFVGKEVYAALIRSPFSVRAVVRPGRDIRAGCQDTVVVPDLDGNTQWGDALEGIDTVLHLAGRAHVSNSSSTGAERCMAVNAHGTRTLAAAAAKAGVRRFIYVSTVKVNGGASGDRPFGPQDEVYPDGPYGLSKWLGEQYLREVAAKSSMECAIVRPPLVYGPGVKANFLALLKCVERGIPLPLKGVRNCRSIISTWNLSSLLITLAGFPDSAEGIWMVSDGYDLSVSMLIELIARSMGKRARLFYIPLSILMGAGRITGFHAGVQALCGSLTVDISATLRALRWVPPVPVEEAIERTVRAYRQE